MATVYKVLGQTVVTANTDTQLYVTSTGKSTLVSSLVVCNTGTSERTFRIAIIEGAIATVGSKNYLYYDVPIPANDSFTATCGFTMAATNTILVRASHADVVFSAFGTEIS
jgi:hypothetical protein